MAKNYMSLNNEIEAERWVKKTDSIAKEIAALSEQQ